MIFTTRQKIRLARLIQQPVLAVRRITGRGPNTSVRRHGVRWRLDLREGIEFAIWLRSYERATMAKHRDLVRPGANVLDIGANVGAHTLPLARLVGDTGRVIACEPTEDAYQRLLANIAANPLLASRIDARQAMLLDRASAALPSGVMSSWPLEPASDLHPTIRGREKSTRGAAVTTVDALLDDCAVRHLDLIKLDVDGYECEVLQGAMETLTKQQPIIVAELGPHGFATRGRSVYELLDLFDAYGYELETLRGRPVLSADVDRLIRRVVSMNVVARPQRQAR